MKHLQDVKFGWKPDIKDDRDKKVKFKTLDLTKLPPVVDLRKHCSPVEDQSSIGSCSANAAAGALEYLEIKNGEINFENFSRLFIYYNARGISNNVNEDTGVSLRDTLATLYKVGACDELLWPYEIVKFNIKPTNDCYKDAENHKITEYLSMNGINEMLACLSSGYPFIFGFKVYESFMTREMASTGVLQMPKPNENSVGWHAVCAVGYDINNKTILLRNSWGEQWGQGGYFTMPFDYISNPELALDFWTIRKVGKYKPTRFFERIFYFIKSLFSRK